MAEQSDTYPKLVIFDLDGVLIDSRELHYEALNEALKPCNVYITREEHLSTYDGLPTRKKLELLTINKNLPACFHKEIAERKQDITNVLLRRNIQKNPKLIELFNTIRSKGWKIAVASNAVNNTVYQSLLSLGIATTTDFYVSNDKVEHSKPHPEMYWRCMNFFGAVPRTTIILEDSHIGRIAVRESGAILIPVTKVCEIPVEELFEKMTEVENAEVEIRPNVPWLDSSLTVVIPMAGMGSRFAAAGYTFPKPLIEVHGKPMIQVVVENLNMPNARHIFVVQKEHLDRYNMAPFLKLLRPNCKIVALDHVTEGAAVTVDTALYSFCNDEFNEYPLVIANSDQFLEWNVNECMYAFSQPDIGGGILTFESMHPKWSYAALDDDGFVKEVAEKKVISNHATCGVYYWSKAGHYRTCFAQMVRKNIRTNGEFYVAPVFNEFTGKIRTKDIEKMWGLGTPEDLNYFLEHYKGKI